VGESGKYGPASGFGLRLVVGAKWNVGMSPSNCALGENKSPLYLN